MAEILFPAGLTIDLRNIGMEEVEYYAKAWNLERVQMQKGFYSGSLLVAHTPHMQLMHTPHSHGILLRGDFPTGVVLIAFMKTQAEVTFQNKNSAKNEIKILKSGDEIDFLCNGESSTYTIAVEEKLFYEAYYAYFGEDFTSYSKDKPIYIDPNVHPAFIQGFERWLSYLMQDHHQLNIIDKYEEIELSILKDVFTSILFEEKPKQRSKFQIKTARELLHQSIEESIDITTLTQKLGISERLLHSAFKENYGFTPKQYLLSLSMHEVQKSLRLADPHTTTISAIIQKYHFYNQSTFSQSYRQMFNERPSDTFNRSV